MGSSRTQECNKAIFPHTGTGLQRDPLQHKSTMQFCWLQEYRQAILLVQIHSKGKLQRDPLLHRNATRRCSSHIIEMWASFTQNYSKAIRLHTGLQQGDLFLYKNATKWFFFTHGYHTNPFISKVTIWFSCPKGYDKMTFFTQGCNQYDLLSHRSTSTWPSST